MKHMYGVPRPVTGMSVSHRKHGVESVNGDSYVDNVRTSQETLMVSTVCYGDSYVDDVCTPQETRKVLHGLLWG
jgi:hypothetical protein